jgi:serine/threonine protein kinase
MGYARPRSRAGADQLREAWDALTSLDPLDVDVMRRSVCSYLFADYSDGPRIDRYRLVRRVDAGASGTVYEATIDGGAGRVAIKVIRVGSATESARIDREVAILAGIEHPRIVRCLGSGTLDSGDRYVVLQWLEGRDLATYLHRRCLTLQEALRIVRGAAEGLAAIHERSVIHRDVKPANLFLVGGAADDVRLIDFGLARLEQPDAVVTTSHAVLGTPAYMAPEQVRGQTDLTPAVDVYALGAVLFECLTGRRAFHGRDIASIAAAVLAGDVPAPSAIRRELPRDVDVLVADMLCPDDRRRPAMRDVLLAIDRLLGLPA